MDRWRVIRDAIATSEAFGGVVQVGGREVYADLTECQEPMILIPTAMLKALLGEVNRTAQLSALAVAVADMQAGALIRLQEAVRHMREGGGEL